MHRFDWWWWCPQKRGKYQFDRNTASQEVNWIAFSSAAGYCTHKTMHHHHTTLFLARRVNRPSMNEWTPFSQVVCRYDNVCDTTTVYIIDFGMLRLSSHSKICLTLSSPVLPLCLRTHTFFRSAYVSRIGQKAMGNKKGCTNIPIHDTTHKLIHMTCLLI